VSALLQAVIDTLLPAEIALPAGSAALPTGTSVLGDVARYAEVAAPLLDLIRTSSGGEAAFLAATADARRTTIAAIEAQAPERLRTLLQAILADYCESSAVLSAFGRSSAPPQPAGQMLAEADAPTLAALENVRARGKLWRG